MMYITDKSCISAQNTLATPPFEGGVVHHEGIKYFAIEPNYLEFIPKGKLRRMGKITKLGIGAGQALIHRNQNLDGILIGTTNGGLEDCVKFLNQIIKYEEGTLTPTNFVQSTSNAVSGTLALMSKNTGYNTTYVSLGLAFESALLDALILIENEEGSSFLIGNVEEISDYNHTIDSHRNLFKKEPTNSKNLLSSKTVGTVSGEGASMFVVSKNGNEDQPVIIDVSSIQTKKINTVAQALDEFLKKNNLSYSDLGSVVLGLNGDVEGDLFYHELISSRFSAQNIITFKNLVGEYPSVSGFALWFATLPSKVPEEAIFINNKNPKKPILIYNHYRGISHGFILVSNPVSLV